MIYSLISLTAATFTMSHAFHAQKRKEKFFKLAKEQGYRSRAAFKLIQLNKKYNFLGNSRACIDLCAAPGGWLQIAAKYMPVNSMIIGVDILPIKPLPNVTTFVEDITTPACRQTLKKQLHGWQVDLVLHDGAPSVGGGATWVKDSYLQTELVLHSLKLATEFLVEGGTFVTKIFRSPDYMALTWVLKQFFRKVEVTKPVASRAASSEVFAVCQGYLAPKKIDPRLFDPAVVFKQGITDESTNKVLNVLNVKETKKSRPTRDGYEDDAGFIVSKKCSVAKYIDTANPSEILAVYNEMYFDEASQIYENHSATTNEIRELIKDLKVLGKGDFAQLIKWHKKMNTYKKQLQEAQEEAAREGMEDEVMIEDDGEAEVDVEELKAQEIEELNKKIERKSQLEKKKKHEAKMKEIKRLALNAHNLAEKNYAEDDTLFSLSNVKSDAVLKGIKKADSVIDTIGEDKFMDIISTNADDYMSDMSESEAEEDDRDYESRRSDMIDELYNMYKARKGIVTKGDKKKSIKESQQKTKDFLASDEEESEEETDALERAKAQAGSTKSNVSMLKDASKEDEAVVAQRWFAQDAFADIDVDDEAEKHMRKQLEQTSRKRRRDAEASEEESSDADDEIVDDEEDDYTESESDSEGDERWLGTKEEKAEAKAKKDLIKAKAKELAEKKSAFGTYGKNQTEGFEEVALSDYSDDSDARAEILALGTKMLRKKTRNHIIDSAYNKYAYNEQDDLPDWFIDDENTHCKVQMPISKAEVDLIKQQLKVINARPIRRLAEAAARKKKGALRKLERAKMQATAISNQEGVSQEEKLKQIEKIYSTSRAKLKEKTNKAYIVSSRSGGGVNVGNKKGGRGKTITVRVDKRMKKDKAGERRAEWRKDNKKRR